MINIVYDGGYSDDEDELIGGRDWLPKLSSVKMPDLSGVKNVFNPTTKKTNQTNLMNKTFNPIPKKSDNQPIAPASISEFIPTEKKTQKTESVNKIKGMISNITKKVNPTQPTAPPTGVPPKPPVLMPGTVYPMPIWEKGKKEKVETQIKYEDLYRKLLHDIDMKIDYLNSEMKILNTTTKVYKEMEEMLEIYKNQRDINIEEFKKSVAKNMIIDEIMISDNKVAKNNKYYEKMKKQILNKNKDIGLEQINAEIINNVMKLNEKSSMNVINIMRRILKDEQEKEIQSGKVRNKYIEDLKAMNSNTESIPLDNDESIVVEKSNKVDNQRIRAEIDRLEKRNEQLNNEITKLEENGGNDDEINKLTVIMSNNDYKIKRYQDELDGKTLKLTEQYGGGENDKIKMVERMLEIFYGQLCGAQIDEATGVMYGGRWFKMPAFNIGRLHELAALQRGRLFGYLLGFRSGFRPAEGNDVQQQLFHQAKLAGRVTPAEFNHYTQGFYPAYRIGRIHCTQGFPRRCFQILSNLR